MVVTGLETGVETGGGVGDSSDMWDKRGRKTKSPVSMPDPGLRGGGEET